MSYTSPVNHAALAYARAVRFGTPEDVAASRADLAAAKIEAAIRRALADAPPLRDEQRAHLTRLLITGESS